MDGTNRTALVSDLPESTTKSLSVDLVSDRLYWISEYELYYSDLWGRNVTKLPLAPYVNPSATTVYKDRVYYADDDFHTIHVTDKTTGADDRLLRNGTGESFIAS